MRHGLVLPALVVALAVVFAPGGNDAVAQGSTAPAAQGPQLVDRIAAIVNGEVITLAQVNRALRLEEAGLAHGAERCATSPATRADPAARMLQCMVDSLLMFQHVRRFPQFDVLADEIENQFQRIAGDYESRRAFQEELRSLQLTEGEVRYDLERDALIGKYIDLRYREVIDISEAAQRRYFEEVLIPEMERLGEPAPAFESVDDEFIEGILAEAEVNRRTDEWIADLRRRASITLFLW
jgi:hypothetical protein